MPEQAFSRKTILITGATDGLGLILLRKLVQMGHDVIGTGRRKRKELPEGWPKEAHYIQADQNKPDVADTIAAWLEKKGFTDLDLLILNAGTGKVTLPQDESPDTLLETLQVNLHAPIAITHKLFPDLDAAKKAQVTFIGSVARKGAPKFASYAASKAGLAGFVRGLASEWKDTIKVQLIDPGPVATGMHDKAGLEKGFTGRFFLDPETVASRMLHHISKGKPFATVSYLDMAKMKLTGSDKKVPLL